MNTDFIEIGYIKRTHGLKGFVVVHVEPFFPIEPEDLEVFYLENNGKMIPYFPESFSFKNHKEYLLKIEGVSHIDQADVFKGKTLHFPKKDIPVLDEESFYMYELEGFDIFDQPTQTMVGKVYEIRKMGNQDMIIVDRVADEVLIPFIDELVIEVDKINKLITVKLPDGYLAI